MSICIMLFLCIYLLDTFCSLSLERIYNWKVKEEQNAYFPEKQMDNCTLKTQWKISEIGESYLYPIITLYQLYRCHLE